MAQIVRKLQKIFALNAPSGEVGVIGSKAGGSPLTSKDLDALQADARLLLGYFSTTSDQGTTKLPYTQEQNAIDYILTTQLKYLFQNGIPEWISTEDYYADVSFCYDAGEIWQAISNNTNFQPSLNTDKWKPVVNPLGTMYIQYPGEDDPSTAGLPGTWSNVSATYAGEFFRVEGGDALAYNGGQQLDQFQGHEHRMFRAGNNSTQSASGTTNAYGIASGAVTGTKTTDAQITENTFYSAGTPRIGAETRPVNETIRIWKRTA